MTSNLPRLWRGLADTGVFIAVIGGLLGVIFVLGQAPTCSRPDPRPHLVRSVQEAEDVLGGRLLLPAYFPDRFRWPPSYRVGRQPWPWVAMHIERRDGGEALVLSQSVGGDPPSPRAPGRLLKREPLRFGEDEGSLEQHEGSYYELRWRRGERRLLLAGTESPETLVRIARTMRSRVVTETR